MVKAYINKKCSVCRSPLNVSLRLTPAEYDLIHEFSVMNPLDMAQNKLMYKICDRKARAMCKGCYSLAKQPVWRYLRDRETGNKTKYHRCISYRPTVTSTSFCEWLKRFREYTHTPDLNVDYNDDLFFFPTKVPCITGVNIEINYFS